MAIGKRLLVAASRKPLSCSRFLGRRLVQSGFGEIATEIGICRPVLSDAGLDWGKRVLEAKKFEHSYLKGECKCLR